MISFKLCPAWSRTLLGLEQCVCVCVCVCVCMCVCVCVCLNGEHMYSQNNLFSRTSSLKYGVQRIFHLHSYTCFQTHTLWTSHTHKQTAYYTNYSIHFFPLSHTQAQEKQLRQLNCIFSAPIKTDKKTKAAKMRGKQRER